MTDSLSEAGLCSTRVSNLFFIFSSRVIEVIGHWEISDLTDTDSPPSTTTYQYMVNIAGVNHLLDPADVPSVEEVINNPTCDAHPLSFVVLTPDGKKKLVVGKATPSDGATVKRPNIDHNLNDEGLMEAVFNTSTLGLHVLESVRNSRSEIVDFDIILTNHTSEKIAGRRVTGMRMLDGWPHTREIGLFDKFIHTTETGEPLAYEHLYEGEGIRSWFQWLATKFGDGLYVTIEDITKRKSDEESLRYTASKLQSTFDGVPAIIALLDVVRDAGSEPVDFIISAANKALSDFTKMQIRDLLGKKMTDLFPEAFRGQLKETYLTVFMTGQAAHMEFEYPNHNRWFSIFVTPQVDGRGIVVAALEITGQKNAEEQKKQNQFLAELDRTKTEFFSNVSHEFRTPLTLMLGPLNEVITKLEQRSQSSEEVIKLSMVRRNTLRLQKLVNTLLDFSRVEAGRAESIFQPTDIGEYTARLASTFRSAIENAGLRFSVLCESTEPVYINQEMWEKIVLNLLSNAFKFTFEGKIEVVLKSRAKYVQLQVRDTGIGIPSVDLDRIFERFTRVQHGKSRTFEGSGIGLALVKDLVKIHGGSIEVKSKVGEGSVFIVSIRKGKAHLPKDKILELQEKKEISSLSAIHGYEAMSWMPGASENLKKNAPSFASHDTDSSLPRQGKLILLVDDNSDMREYLKGILQLHFSVVTANNGTSAMDLIAGGLTPDLVITDIMMPETDGLCLLSSLRKVERLCGVPVILLSAKATEEARIEGLSCGADDYVVKPFSGAELLARIKARIKKPPKENIS